MLFLPPPEVEGGEEEQRQTRRREEAARDDERHRVLDLLTCRGAMGIAGGLLSVKPEPFCLFLGAAEVF